MQRVLSELTPQWDNWSGELHSEVPLLPCSLCTGCPASERGLVAARGKGMIAVALGLERRGTSSHKRQTRAAVVPCTSHTRPIRGIVVYTSIRRAAFLGVHGWVRSVESCTCVRENRRRITLATRGACVRDGALTCVLPHAAVAEPKSTAVRVRQRVAGQGGDIPRPGTYDTRSRRCPYGAERLLLHPWSATYRDSP
jgi:hypothetical protein